MGSIVVSNLGKAYKQYPNRLSRLLEWITFGKKSNHDLKWVLKDISFALKPGDSLGIMGVNGAGKSTLLKMITGTTQPTQGSVSVTGKVAALLELGMGFHPDFTGRQNVYMSGQLLGYSLDDVDRLMPEIEKFAEIGDYIDQPVRVYSSGMQVRLAFSVATMARPDILIVDEALAVGDVYFQAKCFKRIAEYRELGMTLLYVSHSAGDIVKHCDRAILLKNGGIDAEGSSRDVTNKYLDAVFGKQTHAKSKGNDELSDGVLSEALLGNVELFPTRAGYRKEEYRWGSGGAVILDYLISADGSEYPSRIESGAHVNVYLKVRFNRDFDNVVPGLLIKTLDGIFLYGTNSFISSWARQNAMSVSAGDVNLFKFSFDMALNEGHYLLSLGISSGDPAGELVPLDRRYDSILIYVGRRMQFLGIVDLDAKFDMVVLSS